MWYVDKVKSIMCIIIMKVTLWIIAKYPFHISHSIRRQRFGPFTIHILTPATFYSLPSLSFFIFPFYTLLENSFSLSLFLLHSLSSVMSLPRAPTTVWLYLDILTCLLLNGISHVGKTIVLISVSSGCPEVGARRSISIQNKTQRFSYSPGKQCDTRYINLLWSTGQKNFCS